MIRLPMRRRDDYYERDWTLWALQFICIAVVSIIVLAFVLVAVLGLAILL